MRKRSFLLLFLVLMFSISSIAFAKEVDLGETPIVEGDAPVTSGVVSVNGREVYASTTSLDLQGAKIGDFNAFVSELAQLPLLTYVDLSNSNLSNEQMEYLQAAYPNVKFVWVVHMKHWSLRTDAVAFSTQQWHITETLNANDIQVLKYCKDLVALDLGHNRVSDISVLSNCNKMKVLILVDNPVTDLTALENMPDLMYLEIFVARVKDLTPLAFCENMVDLNISFNYQISDIDPILHYQKLQRLWFTHTGISEENRQRLIDTYPNVAMDYTSSTSIQKGWRNNARFAAMRKMYKNNSVEGEFATTTMDYHYATMKKYRDVIFDANYYAAMNPDVVMQVGNDPDTLFRHFIVYGIWENRVASADFQIASYMAEHPEVVALYGTYYPAIYADYLNKFF